MYCSLVADESSIPASSNRSRTRFVSSDLVVRTVWTGTTKRPEIFEGAGVAGDGIGQHAVVGDRDHAAAVLAPAHPGRRWSVDAELERRPHLEDHGAQRCQVDDVALDARERDPVADPEDPAREDPHPAEDGADHVLERVAEPDCPQADDESDVAAEGLPDSREREQDDQSGRKADPAPDPEP